jgi:hypothetical protein
MERDELHATVPGPRPTQWGSAVLAGLAVGSWFLFFPRGIPWSSVAFSSPVVMGRLMPGNISFLTAAVVHLLVAVGYAVVIAALVRKLRPELAIVAGAAIGAVLYVLNWLVVYMYLDWWSGREWPVLAVHLVFGAFVAGAYRGLAARPRPVGPLY